MRKLTIILAFICILAYGQDDTDSTTYTGNWPTKTSLLNTDYLPVFDADDNYFKMFGENLFQWDFSSNTLMPKSYSYNLALGTNAPETGFKFFCLGDAKIFGDVRAANVYYGLGTDNSRIYSYGGNLMFADEAAGPVSLYDIINSNTEYSAGNGISIVNNEIRIGNISSSVTRYIESQYGVYGIKKYNANSLELYLNAGTEIARLKGHGGVTLETAQTGFINLITDHAELLMTNAGNFFKDNTYEPDGLQYYSEYDLDKGNDLIIPYIGLVKELIHDSLLNYTPGAAGETAVLDQTLNYDTLYVKVCNEAGDTCKYVGFVSDTGSSSVATSGTPSASGIAFFTSPTEITTDSELLYNSTTNELSSTRMVAALVTATSDIRTNSGYLLGNDYEMGLTSGRMAFMHNSSAYFYLDGSLQNVVFDRDIEFNLDVEFNGAIVKPNGYFTDGDATPTVDGRSIITYAGSSTSVTITDLDNPVVGAEYTIIGNSDTYTISINDSGNFNLSSNWVGGEDDVITIYVVADNDYIELSRSDN